MKRQVWMISKAPYSSIFIMYISELGLVKMDLTDT